MSTPASSPLEAMRSRARDLHAAGKLPEAIQLQVQLVNSAVQANQIAAGDYHRLGVMLFAGKDFAAAASAFEFARKLQADYPDVSLNLGLCRILTERPREAIPELLNALKDRPDSLDAIDGLAHAYG